MVYLFWESVGGAGKEASARHAKKRHVIEHLLLSAFFTARLTGAFSIFRALPICEGLRTLAGGLSGITRHIGCPYHVSFTWLRPLSPIGLERSKWRTTAMRFSHMFRTSWSMARLYWRGTLPVASKQAIGASVEVVKRTELYTFSVFPRRWGVERSFSWLNTCHRLWKNCERTLATSC